MQCTHFGGMLYHAVLAEQLKGKEKSSELKGGKVAERISTSHPSMKGQTHRSMLPAWKGVTGNHRQPACCPVYMFSLSFGVRISGNCRIDCRAGVVGKKSFM